MNEESRHQLRDSSDRIGKSNEMKKDRGDEPLGDGLAVAGIGEEIAMTRQ